MCKTFLYHLYYSLKAIFLKSEPLINGYYTLEEHCKIWEYITKLIDPQEDDEIFEFGCGTGVYLHKISKICKRVVALDPVKLMILRASEKNASYENVEVFHYSKLNLPFPDNTFDKVISWSNLQYLQNKKKAEYILFELNRITKPKGLVLIGDIPSVEKKSIVSKETPWSISNTFFHFINYFLFLHFEPQRLQSYCEERFGRTKILYNPLRECERFSLLINVDKKEV